MKLNRTLSGFHAKRFGIIIILFPLFLNGCALPLNNTYDASESLHTSGIDSAQVDVQFVLQVTTSLEQDEGIEIEILDEVTGLPYNPCQYNMTQTNEQEYTTTLSFTEGSVVKYRYIKLSDTIKTEALLDGKPIRYRMYYAKKSGSVTDILQTWTGEHNDIPTGTFSGSILSGEEEQPIADILVSVGGQITMTDANGHFFVENLMPGVHNVLFYAIDGKYRTYQQGANISAGMNTPAKVSLDALPLVNVTFHVSTPGDALGAPIYMAGNIIQLGNTFSDLTGGMSINPKNMPQLTQQENGSSQITLKLFAETDLRYKFTLGDGYWNAEQQSSGGFRIRQLIVPNQDLELDLIIDTWRTKDVEPITFNISMPPETSPYDEKFIQFKTSNWTEPLPLWPLGNSNYLYILFSPLDTSLPISYRYCRNSECENAHNISDAVEEGQNQPSEDSQTVSEVVSTWNYWHQLESPTEFNAANIPWKENNYQTGIEFTPQMDSTWQVYAPNAISQLAETGVNRVIFSPQWFVQTDSPVIRPKIGITPFYYELAGMLSDSQSFGLSTGLFPQVGPGENIEDWWGAQSHDEIWWLTWFDSYERLILNYAKVSENNDLSALIIGGKSILPAFPGGLLPDGSDTDVPDSIIDRWQKLIEDIRSIYHGSLIWGTNAHTVVDPLPPFINEFDEIYISIDSPLSQNTAPSFEEISASFSNVIDNLIYEVFRSTLKPISLGIAYSSANGAAQGCFIITDTCYNDGLFLPDETATASIDLDEQTLIYDAIMPVIASRDWITGIIIRGYEPTVILHDASSSIAGKPAWDVIQYWFSGLNTE